MRKQPSLFTLPNLMSLFRILLIPVIVRLYCQEKAYGWTALVLILSGVTDIADGIIARKWNLVSDLGKALDPIADKLTQIAAMWCLLSRFSYFWFPLGLLLFKEVFTGIMSLYAVKKSGVVQSADWHGKVCTVLLYGTIGIHILWGNIPIWLSKTMMGLCMFMMCFSGLLYWYRNFKQIKGYVA